MSIGKGRWRKGRRADYWRITLLRSPIQEVILSIIVVSARTLLSDCDFTDELDFVNIHGTY